MSPLSRVRTKLIRGDAVVAGVLSGTSADGIDVALVRFPPVHEGASELAPPETLAFRTEAFADSVAERLRRVLDGGPVELAGIATLSRDLGLAFGRAARRLSDDAGLALDLVGSHGQTVFHHDGRPELGRATLQLGEGAFVAEVAGAPTVADFRQADVAAGGEGAPLSALADELLFRDLERPAAILNLGGMANLTLLPEPGEGSADPRAFDPIAFDTGPAGSLLDGLARRFLARPFDAEGACAARGAPDPELVAALSAHPFFHRPPPKSTGRDSFGEAWVEQVVAQARERGVLAEDPADLLATAVDLIAWSVAAALARWRETPPRSLVLAGGGARNRALVAALERRTGLAPLSAADFGVHPDAREALVFAVLAARCVLGLPSTREGVTGARSGRVLGAIHPG